MEEFCPNCSGPLAHRLVERSISGKLGGGGWTWRFETKSRCVHCSKLPCMVDGCKNRACIVIRHAMAVGSGKAATGLRNDLWICEDHRSAVESTVFHDEMFGFGCMMVIGALILIGILAAAGVSIFILVGVAIAAVLGIWFLRSTAQEFDRMSDPEAKQQIDKKRQYVTKVRGDAGSVWTDDSWEGDILN